MVFGFLGSSDFCISNFFLSHFKVNSWSSFGKYFFRIGIIQPAKKEENNFSEKGNGQTGISREVLRILALCAKIHLPRTRADKKYGKNNQKENRYAASF